MSAVLMGDSNPGADASCLGVCFAASEGDVLCRGDWWGWYSRHSKRVWFRSSGCQLVGAVPSFRFRRRSIVRCRGWRATLFWPWARRWVVWTDLPAHGWGEGPYGTTYYLCIWTRWSWLHPHAALDPAQFSLSWELLDSNDD